MHKSKNSIKHLKEWYNQFNASLKIIDKQLASKIIFYESEFNPMIRSIIDLVENNEKLSDKQRHALVVYMLKDKNNESRN